MADPAVERFPYPVGRTRAGYAPSAAADAEFKGLLRDETFCMISDLSKGHAYGKETLQEAAQGASGSNMKRHMKVTTEISCLPSMAVHWDAFLLVRADEACMDLMRAFISGPPDTPYSCGLWQFDIALPPSYPDVPPKVKFCSTGSGQVRVNPNLYADGKVRGG